MQDFDEAVKTALDFAKSNQEPVIATADHETGGLLIEPATSTNYTSPSEIFFNTGIDMDHILCTCSIYARPVRELYRNFDNTTSITHGRSP